MESIMSKIAIIGATGRAGSQLLEEALRRGHSVTAIARNTAKIGDRAGVVSRSEEHTSELQSLMRISYAVFCLKKKKTTRTRKPACRPYHFYPYNHDPHL